jgi:superfamily II DNA or RNA helicase
MFSPWSVAIGDRDEPSLSEAAMPMPSREIAWVARVDMALVDRRFGADNVNRCLAEPWRYLEPPRLDATGRLHARLRREVVAGPLGQEPPHKVVVRARDVRDIEVGCTCPRGGQYLCEHAIAVLVDVAVHPGLRDALAEGSASEPRIAELLALRRAALDERTLDERLARWLPARADDDLAIDVDVVRSEGAGAPGPDDHPCLLVRVRRPPSRTPVNPREILAARLAPRHRRLLELAAPSRLHRDALVAARAQASLLVHLLREHPEAASGPARRRLRFSRDPVAPRVDADRERLVARWCTAGGLPLCDTADALLFTGPFPYVWSEAHEIFHPVLPEVDLDVAWGLSVVPSLPLTPALADRLGRALLGRGRGLGVGLPSPEVFGLPPLETPAFVLRLSGSLLDVRGELSAAYGAAVVAVPAGSRTLEESGPERERGPVGRDPAAEERAVAVLREAGLVGEGANAFGASEDGAVEFWRRGIGVVRESTAPPIEVLLAEPLASVKIGAPVCVRVHVGAASGWLETELEFTSGSLKVEMGLLRAALAASKRWIALSDGTLARITDEVAELVGEAAHFDDAGRARLARHHVGHIERWIERFGGEADGAFASLRTILRALAVPAEPALPADLRATVRPYQRQGIAWLQMLQQLGAGGVLADDMGLGKTLMALALLARWKEEAGPTPSLVVCPTSVVGNWLGEAARFTPALRTLAWRGSVPLDGSGGAAEHDLIVTTYGLLRRRIDALRSVRFRAVVFDEAQAAKNADSETARAARRLVAEMRLALSGTPVENRLGELWSIMSLVNPGILGSAADFDDRFERPIAARPDGPAAEQLRAIVRPFVLRRTKAQVLSELPAKTEIERACVLDAQQRRLYDALALTLRQAVKRDIEKRGLVRCRLSVLTAILRLRQMACDPRLVDPSMTFPVAAKRAALLELVHELVAEGRRALVFSQFVELLTLWREDLDRHGIAYEYLDGSTANREAVVQRFQQGSAPLFLVSLRAGGAGLNLTAADTVIHCDPWWNPAVEDQATDRAHRMGQTQPVTVIRLVAQGTIEDKIRMLKGQKRALAAAILGGDGGDDRALSGLSNEDVRRLLGDVDSLGEADENEAPPPVEPLSLTGRELDDLRAIVRWLDRTGVPAKELARQVGVRPSLLSLVLVGHRVRIPRPAAERIRAVYLSRPRPPDPDAS